MNITDKELIDRCKAHLSIIAFMKDIDAVKQDDFKKLIKRFEERENLTAVQVAELGVIKVNGVLGKNAFEASKECMFLANLPSVAVEIYWNGRHVLIYKTDTKESALSKLINPQTDGE